MLRSILAKWPKGGSGLLCHRFGRCRGVGGGGGGLGRRPGPVEAEEVRHRRQENASGREGGGRDAVRVQALKAGTGVVVVIASLKLGPTLLLASLLSLIRRFFSFMQLADVLPGGSETRTDPDTP